jgi:hypothetical protein
MSWETQHIFVVFFQIMTPYAKSLQEHTSYVATHSILQEENFVFQPIFLRKYDAKDF